MRGGVRNYRRSRSGDELPARPIGWNTSYTAANQRSPSGTGQWGTRAAAANQRSPSGAGQWGTPEAAANKKSADGDSSPFR